MRLWFFPGGMVWSVVESTMATLPGLASRGDARRSSSVRPPRPGCLVSDCSLPTPVSPLTTYGVPGNLFFLFFSCAYLIFQQGGKAPEHQSHDLHKSTLHAETSELLAV